MSKIQLLPWSCSDEVSSLGVRQSPFYCIFTYQGVRAVEGPESHETPSLEYNPTTTSFHRHQRYLGFFFLLENKYFLNCSEFHTCPQLF